MTSIERIFEIFRSLQYALFPKNLQQIPEIPAKLPGRFYLAIGNNYLGQTTAGARLILCACCGKAAIYVILAKSNTTISN